MYSTPEEALDLLRALAARQGVSPTDADLEAVMPYLDAILPALAELELRLPPETVSAR